MMSIVKETLEPGEDGSERRRGLRIRQNRPIKIYDPISSRYVGGHTQDVSASGLRLMVPSSAPILPGRLVHVHVGVSSGPEGLAQRRGMMPARIIWIDRSEGGASMTAGVELVTRVAALGAA